jgi:hypothetical protein
MISVSKNFLKQDMCTCVGHSFSWNKVERILLITLAFITPKVGGLIRWTVLKHLKI